MNLLSSLVVYRKSRRSASPELQRDRYRTLSLVIHILKHVQHPYNTNRTSYPIEDIALTPISFRCSPLVVPSVGFVTK